MCYYDLSDKIIRIYCNRNVLSVLFNRVVVLLNFRNSNTNKDECSLPIVKCLSSWTLHQSLLWICLSQLIVIRGFFVVYINLSFCHYTGCTIFELMVHHSILSLCYQSVNGSPHSTFPLSQKYNTIAIFNTVTVRSWWTWN